MSEEYRGWRPRSELGGLTGVGMREVDEQAVEDRPMKTGRELPEQALIDDRPGHCLRQQYILYGAKNKGDAVKYHHSSESYIPTITLRPCRHNRHATVQPLHLARIEHVKVFAGQSQQLQTVPCSISCVQRVNE